MITFRTAAAAVAAEVSTTVSLASRWAGGFGPEQVRIPRSQRPRGAVMLVHGFGSNRIHFTNLERRLLRAGYAVTAVNYPWSRTCLEEAGSHVAQDAASFLDVTGFEEFHVVAHSLGGVVARWAMGNTGVGHRVATLTTLGSPHRGTPMAHLAPTSLPGVGRLLAQVRPDGELLAGLPAPADLPHVGHLAVAGSLDVVVPSSYAMLPEGTNVRNVTVPSCHNALPNHRSVIAEVQAHLSSSRPLPFAA